MNPWAIASDAASSHGLTVVKGGLWAEGRPRLPVGELPALAGLSDPEAYLASHSRSFRFAAAMMGRAHRARVARVYAWCRYTDNIVDAGVSPMVAERRLDTWLDCSRVAYDGGNSGIDLVNRVMGEMADREIPFAYAHDLVRAMRSDLHFSPYRDLDSLRVYTYRAAGVVGRWLTELHGIRDAWMLERATALGRAMQLTNILRDVGEDLLRGRMYLPAAELTRYGLVASDIDAIGRGERAIDASYRNLTEALIDAADADYRLADEGIPHLPSEFRRAAAVASTVYRGIHGAIRRNGYDNFSRRAYTTHIRKVFLAAGAFMFLLRRPAVRPPVSPLEAA